MIRSGDDAKHYWDYGGSLVFVFNNDNDGGEFGAKTAGRERAQASAGGGARVTTGGD